MRIIQQQSIVHCILEKYEKGREMKTVVTVTGIRPDFIRMSEIFKKLDKASGINHALIHTGQHYDKMLSDVFFDELSIRKPDYNLKIGGHGKEHFYQSADISVKMIELLRKENINPDIILFLGDSNSVCCALPLAKEGYKIGHIEAGMRSYDRNMLEELNRVTCDHCSNLLFVYHDDYQKNLYREGIFDGVHVVGNTIVEVCTPFYKNLERSKKRKDSILVDIHRPENFKFPERMKNIIILARELSKASRIPIKWLNFPRAMKYIKSYDLFLDNIEVVDLMSYKDFIEAQYHAAFMISDSGTAQEEPAILQTPVVVPRDYTERPQSVQNNCSWMIDVNKYPNWSLAYHWLMNVDSMKIDSSWLGDGVATQRIVSIIEKKL